MDSSRRRWLQLLGLLFLAPICAEYLYAYDDSTGHPTLLIGNLILFVPLYGCAALLIREIARRAGLGWPGILLLAAAVGLLQAGVIDQSLFSPDYRELDGWADAFRATLIGPLGLSGYNLLSFVAGHLLNSFCFPIAVIEALRPRTTTQPWLRPRGLIVVALLWLGAAVLVLGWHLQTESWHASPAQVVGTGVVVAALVIAAFMTGRRPAVSDPRPAPRPLTTLGAFGLIAVPYAFAPQTWLGVVLVAASTAAAVVLIRRWSRRPGWSPTHIAMGLAAVPLWVTMLAFTYDPMIGEVARSAKYAHNGVMLALVVAMAAVVVRRRPTPTNVGAAVSVSRADSAHERSER